MSEKDLVPLMGEEEPNDNWEVVESHSYTPKFTKELRKPEYVTKFTPADTDTLIRALIVLGKKPDEAHKILKSLPKDHKEAWEVYSHFLLETPKSIFERSKEESPLEQNYDDPDSIQAKGEATIEFISAEDLKTEEISSVVLNIETQFFDTELDIKEHQQDIDYVQADIVMELKAEPSSEIELPEDAEMLIKDDADLFAESLENLELTESTPEARDQVVDDFISPEATKSRFVHNSLWVIGSLVILIIIVGLIFWFKRLELAKDPNWRPYIDKACQYIDCGIPSQRDINKIQLQNRDVTYGDENITVNMIIINSASFRQQYPRIEVNFSDLDGNPLSTHVILPSEYLRAELIGTVMPQNVAIHIEFSLDADTS